MMLEVDGRLSLIGRNKLLLMTLSVNKTEGAT